jgi:hypothetical protein
MFHSEIFFRDEVVQSVVQRPEVQELVQESGLVHTCTSLIRDQRLWYLLGICHCTVSNHREVAKNRTLTRNGF